MTNLTWTRGVRREVLPNGLTVLVQREPSAPVAAVVTHVKAGFFDEPDRWQGISHVLEHMFFKGTPTRGVGQIAKATKAAGGYLNAGTSYDHTSYYVVLPAARLREAVAIQADALMHATVDAEELARELQVIIQEAKRKLDNPDAVAQETLHEVLFDRHRIRRWRIGYEKDLAGFTRDDVYGYYRARYVPSRTIVAIVGDVDAEEALALARDTYGAWPAREPGVDPGPEEPPHRGVRARSLRGDVAQAELVLGWRGVPPLDPLAVPLDLAAGVLSAGRGSRLYRALRESGIASDVSAHHYAPTELGVFSIGATCDADRVEVAVDRIAACVRDLAERGPTEAELERARTLVLTRWSRGMEEMDGRAAALASCEALGDIHLLDREFSQLTTTTAREVREAVARCLDPGAVSGVSYLPVEGGRELEAGRLEAAFSAATGDGAAAPNLPPIAAPSRVTLPARKATSRRAEVTHLALPAFDLLVRRKPGIPVATVGVYLPRVEFDPTGQAGVGALTVRSAIRGAGAMDAAALAYAFERLGGTLSPSVTIDWLGLGTSVLAQHLGAAAALLAEVLSAPRYEEDHVLAERGVLLEEVLRTADDMFRYPFQLALAAAFGDRAYGIPAHGLADDLRTLSVEQVQAWHHRALLGPRGVIVAVGDLDPEAALAVLAGIFGGMPARAAAPLEGGAPWAVGAETVTRQVPRDKTQTAVAMAFPGPSRRDPVRHAADVWGAVASGLGGRLFEALRDRRSLAYTVVANAWQKARAGAFLTYIATSPEREEEARREMLRELARFAEERVSDEELRQAGQYLAGQTTVERQSGAAIAGEMLEAWLAGGGLGDLEDPAGSFLAVTADQVRDVAARTLGAAQVRAEGVVRGTGGGK